MIAFDDKFGRIHLQGLNMNKLGQLDYIILITEAIQRAYGDTIWEGNTDLNIAKEVLKSLREYLYFHSMDISQQEFKEWRIKNINQFSDDDVSNYNEMINLNVNKLKILRGK